MRKFAAVVSMMLLSVPALHGQRFEFYPGAQYNAAVPTPKSFLGYEIGSYFTDHYQMEGYIHALEKARPERVKVIPIGESNERRKMYLVLISAPENMRRLEEIRQAVGKLRDPRQTSPREAEQIAAQTPVIAWMNYANDGNESAAFEACLQVAYHFAAGEDEETHNILKNAVIVLNPAHNPESHQRYIAWMKASVVGPHGTADPNAAEHHGDWRMSTNNNHYQIDLNRDAFAASQKETRIVVEQLQRWHPQVFVDHHGETNEFFFAPFAVPMNLNLPETTRKWAETFGKNNSSAFDRFGWTYYGREIFDLYYPGYWDSYPALNGAIGMTYETDGGGRKGLRFRRSDKTILTFRDGIQHHVVASITTCKTAAENRQALLRDYYEFYRSGLQEAAGEPIKQVVLLPQKDPARAADLVALLLRHRIEVYRTRRDAAAPGIDYLTGERRRFAIPAGSYLIPLAQPQKRLAKALLQRESELEPEFLKQVQELHAYNQSLGEKAPKKRLGFYDVTAWCLPLAYGVDAIGVEKPVKMQMQKLESPPTLEGGILAKEGPATYGYAFSANTINGTRLLARLLMHGYKAAISQKPLQTETHHFPRGTVLVRRRRNPERLHDDLARWAQQLHVEVFPLQSAWTPKGIFWGSRNLVNLKKPKIAVITEEPARQTSYGAIWFLLEKRYDIPFTAIRLEYFSQINLYDYNVLVFPPGSPERYERALGKSGIKKIKQWIENGGVFVGVAGGAQLALRKGLRWTTSRLLGEKPDTAKTNAGKSSPGRKKAKKPDRTPGAIFRVQLDLRHFLTLGYDGDIPVLVNSAAIFTPSKTGITVARFAENSPRISGFVWPETEKRFPGNAYLIHEPMGRGKVILYAEEPIFRLFWRGLERLFLNSLLLGPSF